MSDAVLKDEHLAAMQEAIDQEFERSARLRKVVPEVAMPGATYGVVVPRVVPRQHAFGFATEDLRRPVMVSAEARIDSQQIDDLENILMLVRAATKRLCNVEDRIIAYGGAAASETYSGIRVTNLNGSTSGLMYLPSDIAVSSRESIQLESAAGGELFNRLNGARGRLETQARGFGPYMGPHVAILGPRASELLTVSSYEQRRKIEALFEPNLMVPVIGPGVMASFVADTNASTSTELGAFAVVFGRESMVCDLVRISMPRGSMRGYDEQGAVRYVIEGHFFLRVKDEHALARIWVRRGVTQSNFYVAPANPNGAGW